jgi:hypothetical protein
MARTLKLDEMRAVLSLPEAKIVNPELYEIFTFTMWGYLSTFMANLPDDLTTSEKLDQAINLFFGTDRVTIDTYRAHADFRLPGELKDPDTTYWQPGESLRDVRAGEFVLVRIDNAEPQHVEVQILKHTFNDSDDRRQFRVRPTDFYKMVRSKLIYVSSY